MIDCTQTGSIHFEYWYKWYNLNKDKIETANYIELKCEPNDLHASKYKNSNGNNRLSFINSGNASDINGKKQDESLKVNIIASELNQH